MSADFYFFNVTISGKQYGIEAHTAADVLMFAKHFQGDTAVLKDVKRQVAEAMHGLAMGQASWGMWQGAADCYRFLADVLAQLGNDPIDRTQKSAAPDGAVNFNWWMRDALRQASQKRTIWRDRRTKRGVDQLVKLGLLRMVKETDTRRTYEITDYGRIVAPMLPTDDQEWDDVWDNQLRDFSITLPAKGGDAVDQKGT